jgi:hypothetical protein
MSHLHARVWPLKSSVRRWLENESPCVKVAIHWATFAVGRCLQWTLMTVHQSEFSRLRMYVFEGQVMMRQLTIDDAGGRSHGRQSTVIPPLPRPTRTRQDALVLSLAAHKTFIAYLWGSCKSQQIVYRANAVCSVVHSSNSCPHPHTVVVMTLLHSVVAASLALLICAPK